MIRFTMVCKDDREQAHTTLGLKREVTDEDHDDDASNVNKYIQKLIFMVMMLAMVMRREQHTDGKTAWNA